MKKRLLVSGLVLFSLFNCQAQKKTYFSAEYGAYFGNANSFIEANMISSGFGDDDVADFFSLFSITTHYPRKKAPKSSYRLRAGYHLTPKTAIEIGFGLSYNGEVKGFDDRRTTSGGGANYLTLTSNINTISVSFVKADEQTVFGYAAGPALSFYTLKADLNNGSSSQTRNYVLPGVIVSGFWNFIHHPSWYMGLRTDLSLTGAAKIEEIKVAHPNNPSTVSTFKAMKTGSFNGCVNVAAGFRF